jgi:hypothetical protein
MPDAPMPLRDQPGQEASAPDRRAEGRYPAGGPRRVLLLAWPSLREYQAVLHDVSRQGVGLRTQEPFAPDTLLALRLPGRLPGLPNLLTATARHATAQADGTWLVGCDLSRPLAEEELLALREVPDVPRPRAGG